MSYAKKRHKQQTVLHLLLHHILPKAEPLISLAVLYSIKCCYLIIKQLVKWSVCAHNEVHQKYPDTKSNIEYTLHCHYLWTYQDWVPHWTAEVTTHGCWVPWPTEREPASEALHWIWGMWQADVFSVPLWNTAYVVCGPGYLVPGGHSTEWGQM